MRLDRAGRPGGELGAVILLAEVVTVLLADAAGGSAVFGHRTICTMYHKRSAARVAHQPGERGAGGRRDRLDRRRSCASARRRDREQAHHLAGDRDRHDHELAGCRGRGSSSAAGARRSRRARATLPRTVDAGLDRLRHEAGLIHRDRELGLIGAGRDRSPSSRSRCRRGSRAASRPRHAARTAPSASITSSATRSRSGLRRIAFGGIGEAVADSRSSTAASTGGGIDAAGRRHRDLADRDPAERLLRPSRARACDRRPVSRTLASRPRRAS